MGLLEDLWVCAKDQEKCFLINYSVSHNPFWAERCITLRDASHARGVSFPPSTCLTPSFFSSTSQSLLQRALFASASSLSLSSAAPSFTLPEMDPLLGQAVSGNGGN